MLMLDQFIADVAEGLGEQPKRLASKYFYDRWGDRLFEQIMRMPEYYLTDCELEIFSTKSSEILELAGVKPDVHFELVELGSGDGLKTRELIKTLIEGNYAFEYVPIDISGHALKRLSAKLLEEFPDLNIRPRQGDYFEMLSSLDTGSDPKLLLFLGSNIGNQSDAAAARFIAELASYLNEGDQLLLGVDLIKDPSIVLPAYNDAAGITAEFNLNLLRRINRELGADFDLEKFRHAPVYSKEEHAAKSYIESLEEQQVHIQALDQSFHFNKGEKIHTEISKKYDDEILEKIVEGSRFHIATKVTDSKHWFANYILRCEA
jgi:dimethylhistidine N-methyltransferase